MLDKELIALYLEGSERAFQIFYNKYKDTIFRYVIGMCGEYEQSNDISSASWETFVNKCHLVKDCPSAYLFAIARNELSNHYRKNPTARNFVPEVESINEECLAERSDISRMIDKIQQLPWKQRDALLLQHFAGFSLDELADYQGINRESAKSRVRYAVKKMRSYLSLSKGTL